MNDPKNALARLRDKTERTLGVSEQERSDAQALITLFDSDGVEIDTLKARVAELEAQVRATKAEARSAELGASAVVSVVQVTTDATSLPQVGERVATLSAQYGVSTKQSPDRLIVELLNAMDASVVAAADHARKFLVERDEAQARIAQLEAQAERLAKMYARALSRELEAARPEGAAARYDCKGGPGTTAPACGGCVTCLHRVIEAGEVRAKRAEAQVAAVRTVALNTLALGDDDVRPDDILRALNEVKDEAKTPEPVEKVFDIYSFGLFYMSVCTNMSPAEAELHARKNNPSGTQNGWRIAQEAFQSGEPNPCPCARHPDRIHILFQC